MTQGSKTRALDWDGIRALLRDLCYESVQEFAARHADEHFYGFALCGMPAHATVGISMNSLEACEAAGTMDAKWSVGDWSYGDLNATDLPIVDLWLKKWEAVRQRIAAAFEDEEYDGDLDDSPLRTAFADMLEDLRQEIQRGENEFFSAIKRTSDFEVLLVWADD